MPVALDLTTPHPDQYPEVETRLVLADQLAPQRHAKGAKSWLAEIFIGPITLSMGPFKKGVKSTDNPRHYTYKVVAGRLYVAYSWINDGGYEYAWKFFVYADSEDSLEILESGEASGLKGIPLNVFDKFPYISNLKRDVSKCLGAHYIAGASTAKQDSYAKQVRIEALQAAMHDAVGGLSTAAQDALAYMFSSSTKAKDILGRFAPQKGSKRSTSPFQDLL